MIHDKVCVNGKNAIKSFYHIYIIKFIFYFKIILFFCFNVIQGRSDPCFISFLGH